MAQMLIDGSWVGGDSERVIRRPFDGAIVDHVPEASARDVERALGSASLGAKDMALMSRADRATVLDRAATLLETHAERLARVISDEVGKPITEARAEALRTPALLRLCASEGSQQRGETLPLDFRFGETSQMGMTYHVPAGIVVAITPFNYPLLLVVHKIGPALAGGNAVILKPSSATPLSALILAEILLEAGLPPRGLQVVTGAGTTVGPWLAGDDRVRRVTFTGSAEAGRSVARAGAGKPMSMELGSVCPVVVMPDTDLDIASTAIAAGGYVNAGQVCISTQRVIAHRECVDPLVDLIVSKVSAIQTGDPRSEATRLGPLVSEDAASRVQKTIDRAVEAGALVRVGGDRQGALLQPMVVTEVTSDMAVAREELFGPAVVVTQVTGISEAIAQVNDNRYGLAAGIYTRDVTVAMRFAREAEYGVVQINGTPTWRADLMPYGGVKDSGFGREGPRYALAESTELKTVIFHGGTSQS